MPPKYTKHTILSRTKIKEARANQSSVLIGRYVTKEEYDKAIQLGLRWCRTCKTFLPPHEFYSSDARCIECGKAMSKAVRARRSEVKQHTDNEYLRGWRADNPNSTRQYTLRRYDVDVNWYTTKLQDQGNCCAICKRTCPNGKAFCVDHCHKSDKVRGLLCTRCNIFVGMVEKGLVDNALEYLKKYSKV